MKTHDVNDIIEILFRDIPSPVSIRKYPLIGQIVSERQRQLEMEDWAVYHHYVQISLEEQNLLLRRVLLSVNQELENKDRLLKGINQATMILLMQENYYQAVPNALRTILDATQADRVYLFENTFSPENNVLLTSQRVEITAGNATPQIENPILQNASYHDLGFERWLHLLSGGNTVKGRVQDFPETEKLFLQSQDIISILVVPIFVDHLFWGFIGFDDCHSERTWTIAEEAILINVANSVGSYISRKQAEKKLAESWEALEKRVIERTEQLENTNKELENFAYSISHDLRAPLRHLNGYAQILEKRAGTILEGSNLESLTYISEAARKISRQVDDLLAYSRINKREIVPKPVNMNQIVRTLFQQRLEKEESHRVIKIEIGDLPEAYGDETLLTQAFRHLICNAIKYTRKKPEALISLTGSIHAGEVFYCIKDNGVGFNMENAERIFGVFRRLHSEEDYEGDGIGLANVKRIITRHKGKVWAEAKIEEGATFYVSLPRE
ncbi:MAG: ATP-binding protein [Bacteroidia bacterium]|nr:ATP-binding protein [Bacteroidia bacterium]